MRSAFVLIHRWAGLFIAVFLFIAGLTGAVISWDHELDEWLNPHLFDAPAASAGKQPLPPLELLAKVEAADPHAKVTFLSLHHEEGHNAQIGVQPRLDPKTGELYPLDYNQAFVDPASGEILGKRFWGAISLDSENLLPFLYKLHYSLHIPDFANIDRWGVWFMGIVGIVWLFDCFVGFYLTLPTRARRNGAAVTVADDGMNDLPASVRRSWWQRWKPAWQIKRGASAYRLNLDLHRAFGLWLWAMLFIIAFTSVSMNLGNEVVRPILNTVSKLTPDAFDDRAPTPLNEPITPDVSFATAIDTARAEALRRGWTEPPGSAFYGQQYGLYAIMFYEPGDDHGSAGIQKMLFVDGNSGALNGGRVPWEGTAADVFMQLQFPLHSGRIAGIPGRILLSVMGLVVAMLSLTGIVIWLKKRQARAAAAWRARNEDRGVGLLQPARSTRAS
jgi:uncharacterized iron-regulated membrane protein